MTTSESAYEATFTVKPRNNRHSGDGPLVEVVPISEVRPSIVRYKYTYSQPYESLSYSVVPLERPYIYNRI